MGVGTARGLQGRAARVLSVLAGLWRWMQTRIQTLRPFDDKKSRVDALMLAAA